MACPHVSGAAAVLLSQDPGRSLDELRGRLLAGAESIAASNPDFETLLGRGRIDLLASLTAEPRPLVKLIRSRPGQSGSGAGRVDRGIPPEPMGRHLGGHRHPLDRKPVCDHPKAIRRNLRNLRRAKGSTISTIPSKWASMPRRRSERRSLFDLTLEGSDGYRETLSFVVYITHFADVTRQTGLPVFDILPWRATLHDYDGDGDADAQLIGLFSNSLYQNSGRVLHRAGWLGGHRRFPGSVLRHRQRRRPGSLHGRLQCRQWQ